MVGKYHEFVEQMGRPGDTMAVDWLSTCTRVLVGTARDALRYHAVGVLVVGGQVRAGLPTIGTLRRYHPSGRFVPVGWVGHNALFGSVTLWPRRIVGTFRRHQAVPLYMRLRSGRYVRGCNGQGGLGCRRSGRFGDTFRLGQWVSVVWLLLHTGWSGCTWLDASFGTLRRFVLDEYDKCLDKLNMRKDVQHIFIVAPKKEQVMLFSAPITSET